MKLRILNRLPGYSLSEVCLGIANKSSFISTDARNQVTETHNRNLLFIYRLYKGDKNQEKTWHAISQGRTRFRMSRNAYITFIYVRGGHCMKSFVQSVVPRPKLRFVDLQFQLWFNFLK